MAQGQVPEAVKVLEEGVSKIQLENIMINALETLKIACASKNIPFDYEIPLVNIYGSDEKLFRSCS